MELIERIDEYFRRLSILKFISIMVLCSYLVTLPLIPLFEIFQVDDMGGPDAVKESAPILEFILAVVIAPIIETFIFQAAIFYILRKFAFFRERISVVIIVSTLAFGMAHSYSFLYVLYGLSIGAVLAYSYNVYIGKSCSSFLVVTMIHSVRNMIAFALGVLGS
ncbi:MAG: CPBP family intramembrane metalloprotease [Marinisporobacter sp.]|jgi:hypothetical protein|nr:CPBP family intramembrane metalloprotease [Marinisporobacter sp.]